MTMPYGLNAETTAKIHGVLARYPDIEQAMLYGSRAKGNYRDGSDIDLSLFHALDNLELVDHIRRVGVVFYRT